MRAFQPLYLAVLLAVVSVTNAALVDDILSAITGAATCAACHTFLVPLKVLAAFGDKPFTNTLKVICKALNVVDDDICDGAVALQAPAVAHDLRNINPLGQTATKLCDSLLGLCQQPPVNPYTVPFAKPAPTSYTKPVAGKKPPFQVVHFSDVHIDRKYAVGSEATCTKPMCCRTYADQAGKAITNPAKAMGMRNCDTPATLVHNFLSSIGANNNFSIFTGDLVEGALWLVNQAEVTSDIKTFNSELATLPHVKVYPTLGNHEAAPSNQFPRNQTKAYSAQWVFDTLSAGWEPLVGQPAAQQAKTKSGSYSVVVPGQNLRILSINTVYWYKPNFWMYDDNNQFPDPNGILEFASSQLQAAEDAGQRVWIIAHMPPNRYDTLYDQSHYFDQVINRYKHIISGQFYGHSHQDQFGIHYSDYNNRNVDTAVSNAWIAPSITPRTSNPGFKVYDVDPDTYEIMDAKVYRADLNDPNFQTSPNWSLSYSARETYGSMLAEPWPATSPLDAKFWHRVTEVFDTNRAAFDVYQGFRKGPGSDVDPITCADDDCWKNTVCQLRAMNAQYACLKSTPGLNVRRRDENGTETDTVSPVHSDSECAGPGIGQVFHVLPEKKDEVDWEAIRAEIDAIIKEAEAEAAAAADTTTN